MALDLLEYDLSRSVDEHDHSRRLWPEDEHGRRRIVVHAARIERLQPQEVDGETALAAGRHVGDFEALQLDVVAHLLDDPGVFTRLESGVVGR